MKYFKIEEIRERERIWERNRIFQIEALNKSIKLTDLNYEFVNYFESGSFNKSFIIGNRTYRIKFVTNDHRLYVEMLSIDVTLESKDFTTIGNIFSMHYNKHDFIEFSKFIYDLWNPGGVYAVEKYLLYKS